MAGLKCEDVENVTVSVEHMSAKLLVEQIQLVCEVAKQNGERYPPNSLYYWVAVYGNPSWKMGRISPFYFFPCR